MDGANIVEAVDPEAAFAVLADGSRIEILQALWETDSQEATFSELREDVGMDDSGRFNYHLGKLTGQFVRKTAEGYELRSAGRNIVGALLSGAYTMEGTVEPIVLKDPCPICGGELLFDYQDERACIECENCASETALPIPPGTFVGASIDEFPELADRYFKTLLSQSRNGFCSMCEGPVQPRIERNEVDGLPTEGETIATVVYDCDRCGASTQIDLGIVLLDHPAVVAFHHDHAIDVRTVPLWRLGSQEYLAHPLGPNDVSARVAYTIDEDRLTLAVDDGLSVISVDRNESDRET